jgi:Family of unknown function (DUF6069)
MTANWRPEQGPQPVMGHRSKRRPVVNAGRLWAGGAATAVVAAMIAVVGILIARGLFDVPVLAPKQDGTWGNANTASYALVAFGAGLLATALVHFLLLFTPSPFVFFGWILGLGTLAAVLAPFAAGGDMAPKVTTAVINAIIGVAIWSLTASTARRTIRVR